MGFCIHCKGVCDNIQPLWDSRCASLPPLHHLPQCGTAWGTAHSCKSHADRQDQRRDKLANPVYAADSCLTSVNMTTNRNGTGSSVSAKGFTKAFQEAGHWHPWRVGCQSPCFPFASDGRRTRSCQQNNAPYSSCRSSPPDFRSPVSQLSLTPEAIGVPTGRGHSSGNMTVGTVRQGTTKAILSF